MSEKFYNDAVIVQPAADWYQLNCRKLNPLTILCVIYAVFKAKRENVVIDAYDIRPELPESAKAGTPWLQRLLLANRPRANDVIEAIEAENDVKLTTAGSTITISGIDQATVRQIALASEVEMFRRQRTGFWFLTTLCLLLAAVLGFLLVAAARHWFPEDLPHDWLNKNVGLPVICCMLALVAAIQSAARAIAEPRHLFDY